VIYTLRRVQEIEGGSVTAAALIAYRVSFGGSISSSHQRWAEFGSYLGGTIGSFFALLAFGALILSLWVQQKELESAAKALQESSETMNAQLEHLKRSAVESRFFQMLSLHHEIVKSIDLRVKGEVTAVGRDCIRAFYMELSRGLEAVARGDFLSERDGIIEEYRKFYRKNGHELGHYFRNLYRILKFVDTTAGADAREFSGVLRAQLSNFELALIFYNCLSSYGSKLKPLAEKYAFFENLERNVLPKGSLGCDQLDPSAFGENYS
jgi:hypothetical protein